MSLAFVRGIHRWPINSPHKGPVTHDDVIKRKYFPRYWAFVRGNHRSPVNSPHKGQWHGALMFSLICALINGWVNNREAGDLRRYTVHYDVTVMAENVSIWWLDYCNVVSSYLCFISFTKYIMDFVQAFGIISSIAIYIYIYVNCWYTFIITQPGSMKTLHVGWSNISIRTFVF